MPTKTAAKPAAPRRSSSTRTDRFIASMKPGAAWILAFHVVVVWRDHTWPVAGTAISAITAMAASTF